MWECKGEGGGGDGKEKSFLIFFFFNIKPMPKKMQIPSFDVYFEDLKQGF